MLVEKLFILVESPAVNWYTEFSVGINADAEHEEFVVADRYASFNWRVLFSLNFGVLF